MSNKLPPLPTIPGFELLFTDTATLPVPGKIVPCLLCTKPFIMRPYSGAADQICPECWKTYKDTAKLVCANCKTTICRVVPKVLDNGFYIRPRSVLHVDKCNVCSPGIIMSKIIEIDAWEKTVRSPKIIIPFTSKQYKEESEIKN